MYRTLFICLALLLVHVESRAQTAFVSANLGGQFGARGFTQDVAFPALPGTTAGATYPGDNGPLFDVGGGVHITPNFAVGATVSFTHQEGQAELFAEVVAPTALPTPVRLEGTADVERYETGVHIQAIGIWPVNERLSVSFYGGPSWISVSQDLVTDIASDPEAAALTAQIGSADSSAWGFNVGADVAYFFTESIGVGGGVRYAYATVEFLNVLDATATGSRLMTESRAGGTQAFGGVRLRF